MKRVCRNLIQNAGAPTFGICEPVENVGNTWLYNPHDRNRLQPVLPGEPPGFRLADIKIGLGPNNLENGLRRQDEMLSTERQKTYRRSRIAIGRLDADTLSIEGYQADRFALSLKLRKNNS